MTTSSWNVSGLVVSASSRHLGRAPTASCEMCRLFTRSEAVFRLLPERGANSGRAERSDCPDGAGAAMARPIRSAAWRLHLPSDRCIAARPQGGLHEFDSVLDPDVLPDADDFPPCLIQSVIG